MSDEQKEDDEEEPAAIHGMIGDDARLTRNPMMDSGAVVNACMPGDGGGKTTTASSRTLRSVTGGSIQHFGKASVTAMAKSAAGARVQRRATRRGARRRAGLPAPPRRHVPKIPSDPAWNPDKT